MKVSIIAFGTRGDVQPLLALGKALKNNGHSVRMVAGSNFKQWIEGHGIEAAVSHVDVQAIMDGAEDWLKRGNNPIVNMHVMRQLYLQYGRAMAEDAWTACQEAQLVISGLLSDVYAVPSPRSYAPDMSVHCSNLRWQPRVAARLRSTRLCLRGTASSIIFLQR